MATHPLNDVIQHFRQAVLPVRDEMTDGELLGAVLQQRDDVALAALVRRHGPMVWGVCCRVLRHNQDAEDAFQATFLVLVRKAATIRRQERVASWLYGVAHQTALKARALAFRRSVRERQVTEMPEPAQAEPDLWTELQPLLDQELSRLPDKYRVPIVLCDLEGKTRQEAARQLGWPEGTVATRLAKARAMLTKRLARHGLAVSGGALVAMLSQQASACVPNSVMSATIKAVTVFGAGQTLVPGVISAKVAALTEGVLKAMWIAKLKTGLAMLLAVAALSIGVGLITHSALAEPQARVARNDVAEEKAPKANQEGPRLPAVESKVRRLLQGHSGFWTVAFSPDGKTLASGSWDKTVKFWDVATGKELATLKAYNHGVGTVAFSPDGKILASAINRYGLGGPPGAQKVIVILWDVTTGTERAALKGSVGCAGFGTVAFSPDGKTLASPDDVSIKLWDVTTNKERATLQGYNVTSLAFSPDGKTLASGSVYPASLGGATVKLWDVDTGKEKATLKGHKEAVNSVAFSPDGKTLASGGWEDKTVKLWDVATGKERATLLGHAGPVNSVAYSPDSKTLASSSHDTTIRLWEVATGKQRATLLGHTQIVHSVTYSPDGKTLASGGGDGFKLWDMPLTKKAASARSTILAPEDLDGLWTTLAGEDAEKAYHAIGTLVGANDLAVLLVKGRLRPIPEPNVQQITRWITALDSDRFAVRQKATEELEKLGEQVAPALRTKLAERASLEVRQRIEQLLSKIEQEPLSPDSIRTSRAVEVLEHVGGSEAKKVLETLATGAEGLRLAREAKASLERLNKRVVAEK